MELTAILPFLKAIPEGAALLLVLTVMFVSFFFKRKDVDLSQITTISELQTTQLAQLIKQNTELSEELRMVRKELSEAYSVIDDMRQRITELEQLVSHGHFKSSGDLDG